MKAKIIVLFAALCLLFSAATAFAQGKEQKGIELYRSGKMANLKGDYKRAGSFLLMAIANLPEKSLYRRHAYYQLGLAYLALGKYEQAAGLIKGFIEFRPGNGKAWYNYGLAMLFSGRYKAAVAAFQIAGRRNPQKRAASTFYLGLALLKNGQRTGAARAFKALVKLYPKTSYAAKARLLMAEMIFQAKYTVDYVKRQMTAAEMLEKRQPTDKRPWTLSLSLGVTYNDNVTYLPDDQVLPQDISSKGSFGITGGVSGGYEFYRKNKHRIGVSAGWSSTRWLDVDNFSSDALSGGVYWKWIVAPFQLRARLHSSRAWLDGHSNNWIWGVSPGVSYQPTTWTWTDFDYTFYRSEFDGTPPAVGESRDSDTNWFSLRQNFLFNEALLKKQITYFSLGVNWAVADADGDSVDNSSWGISVSARQGLPAGFQVVLTYAYREADYDNPNVRSASGQARKDDSHAVGLTLFKKFDCKLTAYLSYTVSENNSNLGNFYSYDSQVVSAGVRWDF